MKIYFTRNFIKESKLLSKKEQNKLASLVEILSENPFNHKLHTKKLHPPLTGILSFRINKEYRVLFVFESSDEIKLIRTKHRKDIYH